MEGRGDEIETGNNATSTEDTNNDTIIKANDPTTNDLITETNGPLSDNDPITELHDFETKPRLLVETKNEFMKNEDNYFRGCKW